MGNARRSHSVSVTCTQSKVLPHWDNDGTKILALQLSTPNGMLLLTFTDPEECKIFLERHKYRITIEQL